MVLAKRVILSSSNRVNEHPSVLAGRSRAFQGLNYNNGVAALPLRASQGVLAPSPLVDMPYSGVIF